MSDTPTELPQRSRLRELKAQKSRLETDLANFKISLRQAHSFEDAARRNDMVQRCEDCIASVETALEQVNAEISGIEAESEKQRISA